MCSKGLRPLTTVGATTYSFPNTDATGFPRPLPPARKIGLGRRALAGLQPSKKLPAGANSAKFESSLERDFFVLLEFNADVISWEPQPVRLQVGPGSYVPDVLVTFATESRQLEDARSVLYEVKFRDELKEKWAALKPRLQAGRRYAREQGWRFRTITEREIRTPLLWNAKFLLPYREDGAPDADCERLLRLLDSLGEATPRDLLSAAAQDRWEQARLLSVLWYLVASRLIATDLTQRVTMTSRIWSHE